MRVRGLLGNETGVAGEAKRIVNVGAHVNRNKLVSKTVSFSCFLL